MLKSIFGGDKKITGVKAGLSSGVTSEMVLEKLKNVVDPDLHRDIVSLGFVKNLKIESQDSGKLLVAFDVELTTPACPVKDELQKQCEREVAAIPGVDQIAVNMTAKTVGRFASGSTSANPRLSGIQNIVAVASGKGGVGKSSTTIQLAMALKETGASVGVLDADVYGPSMVLMTGCDQSPSRRTNEAGEELVVPVDFDGIALISTAMFASANQATILRGPMASSIIKQYLTQVDWGELDYLLIDFPPGTGDIQLTLAQCAEITGGVVVSTPQEVALIDARKAIAMFETLKVPVIGIVENQSYFMCDGCDKKHFLYGSSGGRKIARQYGVPLLGQVPFHSKITELLDQGRAEDLKKETQVFDSYSEIAGQMASSLATLHKNSKDTLGHFSYSWEQLPEITRGGDEKTPRKGGSGETSKKTFLKSIGKKNTWLCLVWSDDRESFFSPADLRRACLCASCIDENTGAKLLNDSSVDDSIQIVQVNSVGRYALQVIFSDGHRTGIYTFEHLAYRG